MLPANDNGAIAMVPLTPEEICIQLAQAREGFLLQSRVNADVVRMFDHLCERLKRAEHRNEELEKQLQLLTGKEKVHG